ncbi:MAG TPA: hypothetical protein VIP46_14780 [Pyrinomonadaceae bacterium]
MRYIIVLLVGLLLGGAGVYYLFVGAPRIEQRQLGAQPLQAPDAGGPPPGTIVLTFDEKFFDTLLGTIFRDLQPPAFKLSGNAPGARAGGGAAFVAAQAGGCADQLTVAQEGSGARTSVTLKDGRIDVPLAFSGSRNVFGNCMNFKGAALANIALSFSREQQTLYGQINVEGVNLEGVSPIAGPFVTTFVQTAINQKVNPLVIMRGQQLTLNVPVEASNGTVRAQARDVRHEIKDGALRLHITYDFAGARGVVASPPPQS